MTMKPEKELEKHLKEMRAEIDRLRRERDEYREKADKNLVRRILSYLSF